MSWYSESSSVGVGVDLDLLSDLDFDEFLCDFDSQSNEDFSFEDIIRKALPSRRSKSSHVVKKSIGKHGAKVGQKLLKVDSKTNMPNFKLENMENINIVTAPNMSRRVKDLTLYAFPNFNKCDALLYFPSTMARHLNSGDYSSLSDLFSAHLHKNCVVDIHCDLKLQVTAQHLLDLFLIENDMHPDSVMCMHSTKVVDNEIRSRLYFKCTNNCAIYDSLRRTVTDPAYASLFKSSRAERIKGNFRLETRSEEEQLAVCTMLDSQADVVIYGYVDLHLCFEGDTKRVINVKIYSEVTSVVEAKISPTVT